MYVTLVFGIERLEVVGRKSKEQTMRRKPDRLAGRNLKDPQQRGEWAELYFMMQAAGLGMKVSRPFAASSQYDVGVERQLGVLRVQVKSTAYKRTDENSYNVNVIGARKKRYAPGTVDFFAVLLIPIDSWYIIPYEVIAGMNVSLSFTPENVQQKYLRYREAWHLLKDTGLTIHACVDPDWPEVGMEDQDSSLRSE
jgi:hypothetical protein